MSACDQQSFTEEALLAAITKIELGNLESD
jgi:hypothetical protein